MYVFHPAPDASKANAELIRAISGLGNVTVREIGRLYKNYDFDVDVEEAHMLRAERIVFQFPLYWFNVPALGKAFLDKCFRMGFAFDPSKPGDGRCGAKLAGKSVCAVITTGSKAAFFRTHTTEEDQTAFIRAACAYMDMRFEAQLLCFRDTDRAEFARKYVALLQGK